MKKKILFSILIICILVSGCSFFSSDTTENKTTPPSEEEAGDSDSEEDDSASEEGDSDIVAPERGEENFTNAGLGVQSELAERHIWLNNNLETMEPEDCYNETIFVNEENQEACKESYYKFHLYKEALDKRDYSNVDRYLNEINDSFFSDMFNKYIENRDEQDVENFCSRNVDNVEMVDYCRAILGYEPSLCTTRERSKKVLDCLIELDADVNETRINELAEEVVEEEPEKYGLE
ncbi:MAG: hypothetical protein ACOCQG_06020 [Candidatus Nanoarchaeia archaeon]